MKDNMIGWLALVAVVVVIFSVVMIPVVLLASMEAKTFNKFATESTVKATAWDALFAELRVEGCR